MSRCYISKNYKDLNSAGNKAKTDIERIMQQEGFKNVGLPFSNYKNTIRGFLVTWLGVIKAPFSLKKGDVLVLQYPLKKYYKFLCRTAHLKDVKVITVIHDLGSFRRKKLTPEKEIKKLGLSDYIIVHNSSMKKWLEEKGCKTPMGCLEIFDYYSTTQTPDNSFSNLPYTILYAGALNPRKNTFLYKMGDYISSYHINLYGNGFEPEKAKGAEHFTYKGFVPSDDLIAKAEGDFGLVWDGDSISECGGEWGEYLKYNNPHKTSFYIRCKLPVIIWEKAALADFVEQNKIGLVIDSLEDLNKKLSELSQEQYAEMKKNVTAISDRLQEGYYFTKAFIEAEKTISVSH